MIASVYCETCFVDNVYITQKKKKTHFLSIYRACFYFKICFGWIKEKSANEYRFNKMANGILLFERKNYKL